jgi:hypothetical protein
MSDEFPMGNVPKVGSEYIRLKSGEIRTWSSFDPNTQMFEYWGLDGILVEVHRRDVEIPTSNEVAAYIKARQPKKE